MHSEQQIQQSNNRQNSNLIFLHYDTLSAFRSLEQLSQVLTNNPTRHHHNSSNNNNNNNNNEIVENFWAIPRWPPQMRENTIFEASRIRQPLQYKYVETSKSDRRFLLNQHRYDIDRNENVHCIKKQLLTDWLFEGVHRELDRRRNGLKSDTIAVDSALITLKKLQCRK